LQTRCCVGREDNRVIWTVTAWNPPHEVAMSGAGKGGAKYGVSPTVRPTADGSTLGLRLELGGRPLFGSVGSAEARAVKGDVEKSLKRFVDLYGQQRSGSSPSHWHDTLRDTPERCRSSVIDWRPYERFVFAVLRAPA
jgi:hypothetical protein